MSGNETTAENPRPAIPASLDELKLELERARDRRVLAAQAYEHALRYEARIEASIDALLRRGELSHA